MYTNVNLAAPIGVLLFPGTGLLIFGLVLLLIFSLITKRFSLTKFSVWGVVVVVALYVSLLLIFFWASSEQLWAGGKKNHFCKINCHLPYTILDSKATKTLGTVTNKLTA